MRVRFVFLYQRTLFSVWILKIYKSFSSKSHDVANYVIIDYLNHHFYFFTWVRFMKRFTTECKFSVKLKKQKKSLIP